MFFKENLPFQRFNNPSNIKISAKKPIDLSEKPEPGDDFKIRENRKLMFKRPHGDYHLFVKEWHLAIVNVNVPFI
jgi:hypothetical protein